MAGRARLQVRRRWNAPCRRCNPPGDEDTPPRLPKGFTDDDEAQAGATAVLKGLIIANDPSVANATKLDDEIAKHELVDLVATAKLEVSPQEVDILKALTQLSVWAGRYPVARKLKDHTTIAPSRGLVRRRGWRSVRGCRGDKLFPPV